MSMKTIAQRTVNTVLRPLGVQVIRGYSADPAIRTFVPARSTIAAARRAGMSVGDYLDRENSVPGTTEESVRRIIELGAVADPVNCVCEIGPGSGRYAEKIIEKVHPRRYEVYETAADWLPHLRELPGAVIMPCDGHTLAPTPTASVDVVHANKVFVYLPFAAVAGYLREMARVVRPGGTVAFDVITDDCLDEDVVDSWVAAGGSIFLPVPRRWVLESMESLGLSFAGSWLAPLTEGKTELMVFRRAGTNGKQGSDRKAV
jgi:SAM-dependent methyltransferase